ncbi:MAG: superoxide dismutase [Bacteroidales bacterium]|jgi:superoxide dismutase, Fe-Mn family|nr:superoxide dismutase [Bacteroidales bacterium]MDD2203876.1 superoxide dismutase [Bacteroidales bacterium]MDD3151367.1 superoxide dismutase [Bacteroidales bacterium]MDD3913108.1 superoxide dismutase [Bacteroidales bacterium]MDD4633023.1 superoxide dismutase [Bacteroidales bacterium]
MKHLLPTLPYELNSLEPYISKTTLEYHYGKHHQAYVNNLNNLIVGTPFEESSLETIIKGATGGIFNNAAQIWNHSFYFVECLSPTGLREPQGALAEDIRNTFGSYDNFKELFTKAAVSLFGSGWAWLVRNQEGKLEIVQTSNADNPMTAGKTPIITCDVWEHAYYLDYQNKRPDYINAFWKLINWNNK